MTAPEPAAITEASASPFSPGEDFAARYCRWRGIRRADFVETLFPEVLYPHARTLHHFLPGDWFNLDRHFIEDVGRIRRRREFANVMLDFVEARDGRRWRRTHFRLRISVDRMQALVKQVFTLPP